MPDPVNITPVKYYGGRNYNIDHYSTTHETSATDGQTDGRTYRVGLPRWGSPLIPLPLGWAPRIWWR